MTIFNNRNFVRNLINIAIDSDSRKVLGAMYSVRPHHPYLTSVQLTFVDGLDLESDVIDEKLLRLYNLELVDYNATALSGYRREFFITPFGLEVYKELEGSR